MWLAAFVVPGGRAVDGRALQAFTRIASFDGDPRSPLTPSIHGVARLADPWPFLIAAGAVIALALLRRRWLMAAVVPAILLSANVATQLLKPALADLRIVDLGGDSGVYPSSWPSGHSTAAMSLALCFVLVIGPRLRPLAALLGAGYAIAVGYALVVLGHHLVSDVLGGYLVAATFTLLGCAALAALESRLPVRAASRTRPPAPLTTIALGAFAALLVLLASGAFAARHPSTLVDVLQHPTAVLAAVAIAALGLSLTTGLARMLRG